MKITTIGTQKESTVVNVVPTKKNPILHYDVDYDTCKPEKTIRNFVADVKSMVSRFELNKDRIVEIENELLDIYHYIEVSSYKTVPEGYKLYRKMAELRRERRACKNENDLLQPIYEYFHATEVLGKLSKVQGECAKCRGSIDNRTYMMRTDVVDELIAQKKPTKDELKDNQEIDLPAEIELITAIK